jgi:phage-related protein
MSAIPQIDKITAGAVEAMLVAEPDDITAVMQQAKDALMNLPVPPAESAYRTEAKNKLTDLRFDIAAGQRTAALKELVKISQNITAASQLMDDAAADNILAKVAAVGNTAADTVKSVATTVEALGAELKKVGNGEGELDGAALSGKINDTLDKLNSLKNL